jgi:hypothetical protein
MSVILYRRNPSPIIFYDGCGDQGKRQETVYYVAGRDLRMVSQGFGRVLP